MQYLSTRAINVHYRPFAVSLLHIVDPPFKKVYMAPVPTILTMIPLWHLMPEAIIKKRYINLPVPRGEPIPQCWMLRSHRQHEITRCKEMLILHLLVANNRNATRIDIPIVVSELQGMDGITLF